MVGYGIEVVMGAARRSFVGALLILLNTPSPATTIGAYDRANGRFYLGSSQNNPVEPDVSVISSIDRHWIPLLGDWSGDGLFDFGFYDSKTTTFHLRIAPGLGPITTSFQFQNADSTWLPVAGDWDGDLVYGVGLYDPKTGTFHLRNSLSSGAEEVSAKLELTKKNWKPLAGDWDGDGISTMGAYNPANGRFYLRNSNTDGPADSIVHIERVNKAFKPVVADWDNDGIWTPGLYKSSGRAFYWRNDLSDGPGDGKTKVLGIKANFLPVTGISDEVGTGAINHLPVFDSVCATTATVGTSYQCTAHATDADGDGVSYSLSVAPTGMTIDGMTGAISWQPAQAGIVSFTISATDGKARTISQSNLVTVGNPASGAHVYFLNFEGVTLGAGFDDPSNNKSQLLSQSTTLPPYLADDPDRLGKIQAIINEIAAILAPYDVALVTARPASGTYDMLVAGGRSTQIGLPGGLPGASPVDCTGALQHHISFLFDISTGHDAARMIVGALGVGHGVSASTAATDCMCIADAGCTVLSAQCTIGGAGTPVSANANCQGSGFMNENQRFIDTFGPHP